jgi:hypothetical protein
MIDKLNLTCPRIPDYNYLDLHGDTIEDTNKRRHYKYSCNLDQSHVSYKPHKYGAETNEKFNFSRVELNPKYFSGYGPLWNHLNEIFEKTATSLLPEEFNVTRIDFASDLIGFSVDQVIPFLDISHIRDKNFSIYKGTVYAGSKPTKYVIYDKKLEIQARLKIGKLVTSSELALIEQSDPVTRFEIRHEPRGIKLNHIVQGYKELAEPFFNNFNFWNFPEKHSFAYQYLVKGLKKKIRIGLEEFMNLDLIQELKSRYFTETQRWFEEVPF